MHGHGYKAIINGFGDNNNSMSLVIDQVIIDPWTYALSTYYILYYDGLFRLLTSLKLFLT